MGESAKKILAVDCPVNVDIQSNPQGSSAEGYIRGRHAVADAALQLIDPGGVATKP